jgi:hypothetical protein
MQQKGMNRIENLKENEELNENPRRRYTTISNKLSDMRFKKVAGALFSEYAPKSEDVQDEC